MKQMTILLCLFLLLTALTGCQQQEQQPEQSEPQGQQAPEMPDQPPPEPEPEPDPSPQEPEEQEEEDPFSFADLPDTLFLSSGVGAWASELSVNADGSFTGQYHDMDMGVTGEGYPNGTQYLCRFSGQFTQPVKLNDYTYSMEIASMTSDPPDQVTIHDGIRSIASGPAGLENCERILLYLPQAPVSQLPEDFLSWAHIYEPRETLDLYGIYNETEGTAFVGS